MPEGLRCHLFEATAGWFYSLRKPHAAGCPKIPDDIRTVGPFTELADAQRHLKDQEGVIGGFTVTHAASQVRMPDLPALVASAEAPAPLSRAYW